MDKDELHQFLSPFTAWIQSLRFNQNMTLKKVKGSLSQKQAYYILSNIGKAKLSVPVQVFAKIQMISNSVIAFEVINTLSRKRFLFEYHEGDSLPYRSTDIDSIQFEKEVHNYQVFPYNHNGVIIVGGGFREDPNDENSKIIKTFSDQIEENLTTRSSTPVTEDENSKKRRASNEDRVNNKIVAKNENDKAIIEFENEVNILRQQNIRGSAQLLLYELSIENLSKEVNHLRNNKNHQAINIYDFVLAKVLAPTQNGTLYSASNKTNNKKYTIKESLVNSGEEDFRLKEIFISNELSLLHNLKESSERSHSNILVPKDISIERTPLRTSYYFVSEPSILSLEEFLPIMSSKASAEINKKLRCIVISQILSGLSYLKDVHHRIHGGLNFNTILIGSDGFIKLSGFGHSLTLNTSQNPLYLSSGSQTEDLLLKHVVLSQKLENSATSLDVKSTFDLWSLGCITYKLIYGSHLFQGARNARAVISIFENKVRGQVIEYLSEFMELEYDRAPEIDPSKLLIMTPNLQKYVNVSIGTIITSPFQ